MAKEEKENIGITVKKEQDIPEWYGQVVIKSELAEYAPVKGCIIIRPYGYSLWQKIQDYFNQVLKKRKVQNAYFPLFIPESFFKKEAEHAKGFAPELAWIHNPDEATEERLALRPTSETIMYDAYAKWIRSHRDLPLRINQWCNVVRWEVSDVKLFIRSREFLWQEGHCVYETEQECDKETLMYLNDYRELCGNLLAIPVLTGKKTEKEKFAGAKYTTTVEALMPDGKALQMGTSHNLGQGFAKSFGISFQGKDEQKHIPWQNSWGFSTRLIGALVMTHGDDKGLVLPPSIAPTQIVIVPIIFEDSKKEVLKKCNEVMGLLGQYSVEIDARDEYTPGWKFNYWELKGVPLRIEIGPKDIQKDQVVMVRRDTNNKIIIKSTELKKEIKTTIEDIQKNLYHKAKKFLESNIVTATSWKEFEKYAKERKIIVALHCGSIPCEDEIKAKTGGINSRLIPFSQKEVTGKCIHCGKEAKYEVYFSKSY